jgi:RecA/RadA recombinase
MSEEINNEEINDEEQIVDTEDNQSIVLSGQEKEEILKSVEIDNEEEDNNKNNNEINNNESLDHVTVDVSKTNNIKQDEEIDDETLELYNEFSTFIKDKTEIEESSGIKIVIPTGIDVIDAILGGGFVVGCLNIIVGQPGGGKSTLASQTIGNAQKIYKGKILSGFLDAEESMTTKRLHNLGVSYPKIKPYSDITIEKVFKYIEGLSLFKRQKDLMDIPSLVVWDSIANTLSEKERETEDINSVIGLKARMLSLLIPKYVSKCAEHNICFLAVNQLREKLQMGMFAPAPDLKFMSASKDMPGGQTLKFNAFQLLSVDVKSPINTSKPDCKYPFDGYISKIKCIKNKLFTLNVEVEAVADFYKGFSNFWTNYNFLAKYKRLKTGAWNLLVDDPDQTKFRTKDAENLYNENEKFKEVFDRIVKETIQTELIEKYDG